MHEKEIEKQISDALKAVALWNAEIEEYEKKVEVSKQKKSAVIGDLMEFVKTPSFHHEGKWYLIKKIRKTGTNVLIEMDKKPGSWLKKENKDAA